MVVATVVVFVILGVVEVVTTFTVALIGSSDVTFSGGGSIQHFIDCGQELSSRTS